MIEREILGADDMFYCWFGGVGCSVWYFLSL